MPNLKIFFIYSLFFYFPFAQAQSILSVPKNIHMILINGKKNKAESPIRLTDGEQQIVFRYSAKYRQQGERVRFVSDVIILKFNAQKQRYSLSLPKINNDKLAAQFNKKPLITLTNENNFAVPFIQDTLHKIGLQVGRNIVQEMQFYNQSKQVAAINLHQHNLNSMSAYATTSLQDTQLLTTPPQASALKSKQKQQKKVAEKPIVTKTFKPKSIEEDQAEILEMLDYWYGKANNNTKKKFKEIINKR